ncbi:MULTISPECIES: sugar phosphate isomerase/epimerase [unclassified Pseudomonas]|uniref:sugar phosphate isomerase/epimerase family protein n=1 Tax=unclassified Pseudomonas TaxID=196821 RepID=UPI000A1E6144|nr:MULTISPECIES: TIM barrel protein [unclassified Pseudomonas]MCX4219532.1 sugar phosphate isomerase/epimerase [Pseudomonas sp. MCal1]UDI91414.1 sugar phosphate isomerase/epimerase [Pseudomonas sp. IAC-BECa141]
MRISISNIAWSVEHDEAVASILNRFSVDAIDVAPSKYFSEPAKARSSDISSVRDWWNSRGIEIVGMQSLLFGTTGLNVFGTDESRSEMIKHLSNICRIGEGLGAKHLVFGSPKNRDRSGLTDAEAASIAIPFFRKLGDVAGEYGTTLCLEPNPVCYGANYMVTSAETAQVVREVDHPFIKMQFDTGALTITREQPSTALEQFADLIGHVHSSEPNLVPLGDGATDHKVMSRALHDYLPKHIVCIEMLGQKNEPNIVSIERALGIAVGCYRENISGCLS